MFSVSQKQFIAQEIERTIRSLHHPEMDDRNIRFKIHIDGRDSWSFADITDNKTATENGMSVTPFNEAMATLMRDPDENLNPWRKNNDRR